MRGLLARAPARIAIFLAALVTILAASYAVGRLLSGALEVQ